MSIQLEKVGPRLRADPRRVIAKPFAPGGQSPEGLSRIHLVVERVRGLTDERVEAELGAVRAGFGHRHRGFEEILLRHAAVFAAELERTRQHSPERHLLVGAYLTHEFSVEGAALCNPSMVLHPDQPGTRNGRTRFLMSVRAIGEGHISCVEFRTGSVWPGGVTVDDPGDYLTTGELRGSEGRYDLIFPPTLPVGEQLIWPVSAAESQGMEDVRLVRFTEDDGSVVFHGTYTAYDGTHIAPHVLSTNDFQTYRFSPHTGPAAQNKGMALFPRRIDGACFALSRWDGQNLSLATSADGCHWERGPVVYHTADPWRFIQVGNCGSPIETGAGWLVLTHGVGPMRTYHLGAILLDLDHPDRVIAETASPLLTPESADRDGYVPNVVYSCGALWHEDTLTIPYGINDSSIGFAQTSLSGLLDGMRPV